MLLFRAARVLMPWISFRWGTVASLVRNVSPQNLHLYWFFLISIFFVNDFSAILDLIDSISLWVWCMWSTALNSDENILSQSLHCLAFPTLTNRSFLIFIFPSIPLPKIYSNTIKEVSFIVSDRKIRNLLKSKYNYWSRLVVSRNMGLQSILRGATLVTILAKYWLWRHMLCVNMFLHVGLSFWYVTTYSTMKFWLTHVYHESINLLLNISRRLANRWETESWKTNIKIYKMMTLNIFSLA